MGAVIPWALKAGLRFLCQASLSGGARAAGYTDLYVILKGFSDDAEGRLTVKSLEGLLKTTMGLELEVLHLLRAP